ncbi:hypothetical protein BOTBODRAFT_36475 [Botryobasidium botryosum FD-172 SS1]|uniref:Protein kinase domain-containing protein n=1 Tax=Botryobasidium botryosum (strain FD-172 SS1) TaxID=930990 RepID=A0A067M664_BOTB1|nr:hypothetical protein BOTBODRAFT_36475 [Botryobasidium botryosum FD-172 SS1]
MSNLAETSSILEENEARMKELRQLISSGPLYNRDQLLDELSYLYDQTKIYPSDPTLYEWEVVKTDEIPIARGGFNNLFRGLFLGRHRVAMKCSRTDRDIPDHVASRRAEREMKVWKRLRHPHVLPFIGSVTLGSPSRLYMVSPWMDNGDLGNYLKTHPDADCALLLSQIISGIEYLHTSVPPIVHGNLKSKSILVSKSGEACLGSLHLSEVLPDLGEDSERRTNGNSTVWKFAGNPKWQAPELWDDDGQRTTSSDMFAFGRVMFEVYMRDFPFAQIHDARIIDVVSSGKQPPRSQEAEAEARARGFDDEMLQHMDWCCSFKPHDRPRASDIANFFKSVLETRRYLGLNPKQSSDRFKYATKNTTKTSYVFVSDLDILKSSDSVENSTGSTTKATASNPDALDDEGHNTLGHGLQLGDINAVKMLVNAGAILPEKIPLTQNVKALVCYLQEEALFSPEIATIVHQLCSASGYKPPALAIDLSGVVRLGTQPLGRGGFGECWQGLLQGKYKVAMKCSHRDIPQESILRQARREATVWQRLHHLNILPFLGLTTLDSVTYLVSPWMENGDLLIYVRKNPHADCLKLLLQVAKGVEYLHTFDPVVVHGDLKAANILITSNGEVQIADFGLAHGLVEGGSGSDNYSTAWKYGGNVRWQAPEIMGATTDEEAKRTTRSDMFAFGRVITEAYTQDVPFADLSAPLAVATWVVSGKLPTRPTDASVIARGLDDQMWGLVKECCRKYPFSRITAKDAVRRLRTALEVRDNAKRPFLSRVFS